MRSIGATLRSLVNFDDDDISVEAKTFGWLWLRAWYFLAVVLISSLTNAMLKSR